MKQEFSPLITVPSSIANVSAAEMDQIKGLFAVWLKTYERNAIRSRYADAKISARPSGNIPAEAMARVSAALGWPMKAVTGLASRCIFDGFVVPARNNVPGEPMNPFGINEILNANRFDIELPQAITSSMKHSCSFLTTALGDVQAGEPEVLVMARSAMWSAATWDNRRRAVSGFLAITDISEEPTGRGRLRSFDVYLPGLVLNCSVSPSGRWSAIRREYGLKEVLAEPLAFDPQIDRPFGRSRISRPVMNITDHALSTIVRAEIGADFYTLPKIIITRLAEDAFKDGKWKMTVDRVTGIPKDEDGDSPDVTQLQQMTMQPLLEQYRLYASMMAAETNMPVTSFGIIQDNPPSAEGLYAAKEDLIVEANAANRNYGASLSHVARRAIMLRDGQTSPTAELMAIESTWQNPAFTSPAAAADGLVKIASVFPWIGDTDIALRYAGFSGPEAARLLSEKQRAAGGSTLQRVLAARDSANAGNVTS